MSWAKGKEAKLCFGGHILMENRNGLCADFAIHNPISQPEPAMALRQVDEHTQVHMGTQPKTLGADKNYHQRAFVEGCRPSEVSPHAACKDGVQVPSLDARTTAKSGYRTSQKIRKRVEEIFG